jgi:hypothetical protein
VSVFDGLADYLVAVQAGFDTEALRPPATAGAELARLRAQPHAVRALTQWCLSGVVPRLRQRLTVGALRAAAGGGDAVALMHWAEAFARQMDGGIRLDALPTRAAGLAWRVRTKLNDARPWRSRQADDPWDAGWAQSTPQALRRLQTDWMPRRATLVLADAADHVALRLALTALWQRHPRFRHPVRWLWVGGGSDFAAAPGQWVESFQLLPAAGPG